MPRECRRILDGLADALTDACAALPGAATGLEASGPSREGPWGLVRPWFPRHTLWVEPTPERGRGGLARRGIESRADGTHPIGGLAEVGEGSMLVGG